MFIAFYMRKNRELSIPSPLSSSVYVSCLIFWENWSKKTAERERERAFDMIWQFYHVVHND